MNRFFRAAAVGVLLSAATAGPAAAADVTVRVEGGTATLTPQTAVKTSSSVVVDKTDQGGTTCSGLSAGGALELATGGDWGGKAYDFGSGASQAVETIKGEAYPFSQFDRYWSFYVNNAPAPVGACDFTPAQGDEILFAAACADPAVTHCATQDPLDVRAPATARPGEAFNVTVEQYTSPFGATPTKAPAAGATVTGGGQTATAGANGVASVSLTQRGPVTLTATKERRVRDEAVVCVTDGADGFCGTTVPPTGGGPSYEVPPSPTPTPAVPGDTTKPAVAIRGLRSKYRKGKGPRKLRARLSDAGGIGDVKIALTRKRGGKCAGFGDRKAKFRRIRCGRRLLFSVGSRPTVNYLLPKKLGRGKYRFDVIGIDKAGNRTEQRKRFRVK